MKKSSGFTLVEMLVAIALLAIIGAALVTFLPTIVTLNRNSTGEQEITVDAKRFFESVRQAWQDGGHFEAGTIPIENEDGTEETVALEGYAVSDACTVSVMDPDAGSPGIRKRVTLTCDGVSTPFIAEFGNPG